MVTVSQSQPSAETGPVARPGPEAEEPAALLPCPFCGEAEELYPAYHGFGGGKPFAIDCVGCGIDFTPREGADVAAAWNRRAALASDPSPQSARVPQPLSAARDEP